MWVGPLCLLATNIFRHILLLYRYVYIYVCVCVGVYNMYIIINVYYVIKWFQVISPQNQFTPSHFSLIPICPVSFHPQTSSHPVISPLFPFALGTFTPKPVISPLFPFALGHFAPKPVHTQLFLPYSHLPWVISPQNQSFLPYSHLPWVISPPN